MSKIKYPAVIVVEGASDKLFLTSFLDAEIIITNGSEVSRGTIDFIKKAKEKNEVVVLTDPDFPGKKIRDTLNQAIPGLKHAFIPKEKAIKKHKVGVAECDKETVLEALRFPLEPARENPSPLTFSDLYDLGLVGQKDSSEKREALGKKLHIGFGNAKTFLKRANSLMISKEELEAAMHG